MKLGPGVHVITEAEYHADPCVAPSLSGSVAKLLVNRSPLHAWMAHPRLNPGYRPEHADKFDLGSAFHALYLGAGPALEVVHANDWRTNAAKDAREAARQAGRVPVLAYQFERAEAMVRAVRAQVEAHAEAGPAFARGLPEQTLVWRERSGVYCRARLDWMPGEGVCFPDLKTTEGSAGPEDWGRGIMFNVGYDLQDAFYRRGLKALGLADEDAYLLFVVAELEPPHVVATHRCSPSAAALADRKVALAVDLWTECLEKNSWPGYRPDTAWHDAPPWHEQAWEDREWNARARMGASA